MEIFWTIEPGPSGTSILVIFKADRVTRELKDQKRLKFHKRLTKEDALKFVQANYQRGAADA